MQLPILAQFEQAAVQNYLTNHNLPLSDAQYIYSYGGAELRNEIRAYMLQLIVAYADSDLSKLNDVQSNAYYYLQAQVQAEEKQYWAAAAAEYASWKADPCHYKLDVDVATQQGLQYDPTQWCYPSLASEFSTPEVPDQNYFLAVAWKKTYCNVLSSNPQNTTLLLKMQTAIVAFYAGLSALPGAYAVGAALGVTAKLNADLIAPFLSKAQYAAQSLTPTKLVAAKDLSYVSKAAQADVEVTETAPAATDTVDAVTAAADLGDILTAASTATIIAVAVFAIETAVEAGIDAVNTQKTLDQIATLPAQAAQIAQNPPALSDLLGTADGYTKASVMWLNATLPDFPSTLDAALAQDGAPGVFWVKETGASTSALTYLDLSSKQNVVRLRGGWFINQAPAASSSQFVGAISYLDWSGNPRYATRVGPSQFLVYREQPLSTDYDCTGANGVNNAPSPDLCYSYPTNSLEMRDANNHNITVEVVNLRTLTPPAYAGFDSGRPGLFTLNFSPAVNDVPCSLSISGLPTGLSLVASTAIEGTPASTVQQAAYNTPLTLSCGGTGGLSTTIPFQVVVGGSNLQFTSPSAFSGVLNYSVNFPITTTGFPVPKLTATLYDKGIRFTDNGNGTATITSDPSVMSPLCPGPCPKDTITADNGIQRITQTLKLTLYFQQVTFLSPTQGSNIQFPVGLTTSYIISTKGNFPGYALSFSGIPSWLTAKDNGDGTGTISGTAPLGSEGSSSQLTITANPQSPNAIFAPPSFPESVTISAVPNPKPILQVKSGTSPAFVAGVGQAVYILSNISTLNGIFEPTGPMPPGLTYEYIPCLTNACGAQAVIGGTPPVGSGGDYKVPFVLANQTGSSTQTLDIVIYDKPQLASSNRIIFYAGQPATSTVSLTGFPLKPAGPFSDGVGYSPGVVFYDPTFSVPPFLKLISGLGGAPNGTATLTSSATSSNLGLYPVSLYVQEYAAPAPALTDAKNQLSNTYNFDVYVVPPGDVNLDFKVDCQDLSAIKAGFGKVRGTPGYDSALDVNRDGIIDVRDLAMVASKVPAGTKCTQ